MIEVSDRVFPIDPQHLWCCAVLTVLAVRPSLERKNEMAVRLRVELQYGPVFECWQPAQDFRRL